MLKRDKKSLLLCNIKIFYFCPEYRQYLLFLIGHQKEICPSFYLARNEPAEQSTMVTKEQLDDKLSEGLYSLNFLTGIKLLCSDNQVKIQALRHADGWTTSG